MSWFRKPRPPSISAGLGVEDSIWNRAALEGGGESPRLGDRALSDLLLFHGAAMNGGLLHAYDVCSAGELSAAIAGYRFFGLDAAAAVVEWVVAEASGLDLENDHEAVEDLEQNGDERYAEVIPTDSALVAAFERHYAKAPADFAPIDE